MQQPGTIVAIYSLFSKSDGNGHFRRSAHGLSKFHLVLRHVSRLPTSIGMDAASLRAAAWSKTINVVNSFATGAGKQLMTMETSGLNIWGHLLTPFIGARPQVIGRPR